MTTYASVNFKTKKAFKEAVAKGDKITCRTMTPFGTDQIMSSAREGVSGPWHPEPHKWYADVTIVDGYVTSVK